VALVAICGSLPVVTAADAAPRSYGSRTLAQPMRGPDVKQLQRLLTAWGLPTSTDGQFGRQTKSRMRSWERHNERAIDGRATRAEQRALRSAVARGETLEPVEDELDPTLDPETMTAPTSKATIGPDGLAVAPADAPAEVQAIIEYGNRIHDMPYKYGGGHGKWRDTGYDCSGSMSYAFHGAGMLDTALDSTGFMSWGEPGKGQWVTTYANAGHSYMVVAGLRFDTSGRADAGSRWQTDMRSAKGYTVRHPPGL
jgi:peptidoglycan hydrolase-like protein with peptidoglycan-binding domain